jgi:hypothetical protein
MRFTLLTAGYLALHFGFYLAVFRRLEVGRREAGIFAYHAVSFALLAIATTVVGLRGLVPLLPGLLLALGLHGCYSLSFLELWALTHRGYSLAMLSEAERTGGLGAEQIARMSGAGAVKRSVRTDSLQRLGLSLGRKGPVHLSRRGRAVAAVLAGVVWLTRGQTLN